MNHNKFLKTYYSYKSGLIGTFQNRTSFKINNFIFHYLRDLNKSFINIFDKENSNEKWR